MFITKNACRGGRSCEALGATLALPLLDAMVPALSAAAGGRRRGSASSTSPTASSRISGCRRRRARTSSCRRSCKPLEAFKSDINVLSGLSHLQADTFGDGTGDHPRASASGSPACTPTTGRCPASRSSSRRRPIRSSRRHIGKSTPVPSLELTVDYPTQGACDSGDCFYVNTVSWRNETTPNPTEIAPARRVRAPVRRRRQRGRARSARIRKTGQHSRFGQRRK